ncbi:MAG: LPS export ABC transporter permease LptG [Pseudoprimorskyibacter sp.]|nr:LPS export ABC transporter permease LptG [Pseudoprimorskyibacter sp.]
MKLHLYIARRFLTLLAMLFGIFFAFTVLLDLVEQIQRFDDSVSFAMILEITFLNAPEGMYQILPLIVILASIALFLGLARSSELVVIRAAGRSGTVVVVAPAIVAMLVAVLAVGVMNPIVAATSKRYEELRELYRTGGNSAVSIGREGLWLRQGDEDGQAVIHAARTNPDATRLYDISFVMITPDGIPFRRVEATEAELVPGHWVLSDATSWPLAPGLNAETNKTHHDQLRLPSTLTQERIRDSFGTPSAVPLWELLTYIEELEKAGFSARRHLVWLNMELSKPVFLLAMVLVAAGFTMGHSRMGRTGVSVLSAILVGFGLYYMRNFAQILGENGQVNAYLAAWAPPIASNMLALGLILHREES